MRSLLALTLEELKVGLFNTFNGDLVFGTKKQPMFIGEYHSEKAMPTNQKNYCLLDGNRLSLTFKK